MSTSAPRVGVNLLTCNLAERPHHLRATQYAVMSLLDSDLQLTDWRLQVVDNGSTSRETIAWLEKLASEGSRIRVHFAGKNLGIAVGRNLGYTLLAEWHAPRWVVEIHTDHIFPREWLMSNLDVLRRRHAGIVGSGLVTQHSRFAWRAGPCHISYRFPYERARDLLERVVRVYRRPVVRPGLAHPCVQPTAMWEEIGFLQRGYWVPYDPRLPGGQNFEDTELAFRAYKAGWEVLVNLDSIVFHHYYFSRLEVGDHAHAYNANYHYLQHRYGEEFVTFATKTLGEWMNKAYAH